MQYIAIYVAKLILLLIIVIYSLNLHIMYMNKNVRGRQKCPIFSLLIEKNNKTWVWEADQNKIEEAQKAYDDFVKQEKIDALQKEIDNWNDYIAKVEDSSEIYEREINAQVAKAVWGENWMEQINQDMVDNIDKTVYQAVGKLEELINTYDKLYTSMTKITNMTDDEIISKYDLNNADISDLVNDPNSGLTYNKNVDYQAQLNELQKEIARQEKETGTHETWLDEAVANTAALRNAKSNDTGATYGYTAVGTNGTTYSINSATGKNFIQNSSAGDTLAGGDGSSWTKNSDGSVTITDKSGNTFTMGSLSKTNATTYGGSSSGSSSSGNSSSSSSSSGSSGSSSSGKTVAAVNGKAPSGLSVGDKVSTNGGTYQITSVNKDGSYTSTKVDNKTKAQSGFATGGINTDTDMYALHGERQRAEVIFNAADAKKLWNWIHNMDENCDITDIGSAAKSLMSSLVNSNTDNSTDIHIEHLELPSVNDSNSFVKQLKLISLNR